ncbi:MAG: hypothetical protein LBI01_04935 [Elusimicrobium sp.]|jgi:hypothetical protein|nr:hypothetical protein [Elusimicrobium sp.]
MRRLLVLPAFILLSAPALFAAKELPSVYLEMKYSYTLNLQSPDEKIGWKHLGFVSKPALLLDHHGYALAKTADYEGVLQSYAQHQKDAAEHKIASVGNKIILLMPDELHYHYFITDEKCIKIDSDFCIFKANLPEETSENAKILGYQKIFTDKKDAGVFKHAFQYNPKDDPKMDRLKNDINNYFIETTGTAYAAAPSAQNIAEKINAKNTAENNKNAVAAVEKTAETAGFKK